VDIATFERRGRDRWARTGALLRRVAESGLAALTFEEVEELVTLHRQVVADFAFSRTHFGPVGTTERLRALAFEGHRALTPPEGPWLQRLRVFYGTTYPRLFRATVPFLAVALSWFVGFTLLGFLVTSVTPTFPAIWIGQGGVDQLQRGEIWTDGVHLVPPSVLSAAIFTNNIGVGIFAWASGAVFGLGTAFVLGSNGAMFGAILALAWQNKVLDRVLAFVASHGPLELFLIVCCSAAGFALAEGLVRPTDLPRRIRFGAAARDSVQLMLGTIPWFVLLGIVEGFVSPDMSLDTETKGLVGILVLATFLAYVSVGGRGASVR
jgi:uncharacterized membrane protein SpoIIM required for sporulation